MKKIIYIAIFVFGYINLYSQTTIYYNKSLDKVKDNISYMSLFHHEIGRELMNHKIVLYKDSFCTQAITLTNIDSVNQKSQFKKSADSTNELVIYIGEEMAFKVLNSGVIEVWSYFDGYTDMSINQSNRANYFPVYYLKTKELRRSKNYFIKSIFVEFGFDYLYKTKGIDLIDFSFELNPYLYESFYNDLSLEFLKKIKDKKISVYTKILGIQSLIKQDSIPIDSIHTTWNNLALECEYKNHKMKYIFNIRKIGFGYIYGHQSSISPIYRYYMLTNKDFFNLFDNKLNGFFNIFLRELNRQSIFYGN